MKNTESLIFMIEGGKALELVRRYIASRIECRDAKHALVRELGCERFMDSRLDGRLFGVHFPNGVEVHADFKRPDRQGYRSPRKGSAWEKRFADLPTHPDSSKLVSDELGVPTCIGYKTVTGSGFTRIGNPLHECGFLYLGENGPYAMWIPDVQAEVANIESCEKATVDEPCRSFVPEFEGCRRIEEEEWEIMVANHKLGEKRKKAKGGEL